MSNIPGSDENTGILLVTGATGLIGSRLVPKLMEAGYQIIVLSRRPEKAARLANGIRVVRAMAELPESVRLAAIVHLAGEPVASRLWSAARKRELKASRVLLPGQIGGWLAAAESPPSVWLSASAVGWYGTPLDPEREFVESDPTGAGFAAELCAAMEEAAEQANKSVATGSRPRLVQLRIGLVLAPSAEGGFLAKLATPVKMLLGATLGDGKQWQSWIHIDDTVNAILHCLSSTTVSGPVNLTAPEPVRADEFMRELGAVLRRPVLFRVPTSLLRLVAGDMADDLLVVSQRVAPKALLESGFEFSYPQLRAALTHLLSGRR